MAQLSPGRSVTESLHSLPRGTTTPNSLIDLRGEHRSTHLAKYLEISSLGRFLTVSEVVRNFTNIVRHLAKKTQQLIGAAKSDKTFRFYKAALFDDLPDYR